MEVRQPATPSTPETPSPDSRPPRLTISRAAITPSPATPSPFPQTPLRSPGTRHGVKTYSNGGRYDGQFINCRRHGEGVFETPTGGRYTGQFCNGSRSGQGEQTYPDGAKYKGEWIDERHHGEGLFVWPSGQQYKGHYQQGKRHGHGVMKLKDGTVLKGDWQDDLLPGYSIATPTATPTAESRLVPHTPVSASHLFDRIDVNGDGVLDRSEFSQAVIGRGALGAVEDTSHISALEEQLKVQQSEARIDHKEMDGIQDAMLAEMSPVAAVPSIQILTPFTAAVHRILKQPPKPRRTVAAVERTTVSTSAVTSRQISHTSSITNSGSTTAIAIKSEGQNMRQLHQQLSQIEAELADERSRHRIAVKEGDGIHDAMLAELACRENEINRLERQLAQPQQEGDSLCVGKTAAYEAISERRIGELEESLAESSQKVSYLSVQLSSAVEEATQQKLQQQAHAAAAAGRDHELYAAIKQQLQAAQSELSRAADSQEAAVLAEQLQTTSAVLAEQLRGASELALEAAARERLEVENADLRVQLRKVKGQLSAAVGTVQHDLKKLTDLWMHTASGLPQLVLDATAAAREALTQSEAEKMQLKEKLEVHLRADCAVSISTSISTSSVTQQSTNSLHLSESLRNTEARLSLLGSELAGARGALAVVRSEKNSMQHVLVALPEDQSDEIESLHDERSALCRRSDQVLRALSAAQAVIREQANPGSGDVQKLLEHATLANADLAQELLIARDGVAEHNKGQICISPCAEELCEDLTRAHEGIAQLEESSKEQVELNLQLGSALVSSRKRVVALEIELHQSCHVDQLSWNTPPGSPSHISL